MARAAGNTAPEALAFRQAVPLALVAVAGALSTVLFHPVIGLPIAGVALAGLAYGRHSVLAVLSAIIGGVAAGVLASGTLYVVIFPLVDVPTTARAPYVYTALLVGSLLLVGPVASALMRRRSAIETTVVVASVLTAMQVATVASFASGAGMAFGEYLSAAVAGVLSQAGMGEELGQAIISMWPGVLVTMNGFTATLAVLGAGLAGARFGVPVKRIPPLARLDLDVRMVVLPIVAVALLAASKLPLGFADAVGIAGSNLLVIARWVFFLQGVAVFAGLYERAKFARPVRVMGFILLGVTEAFAPAVSLTGLADMWINLRRLPRDGAKQKPPEATSEQD